MKEFWIKYSYFFTISFFLLGFVNILFAWIGLFCFISPFVFALKDKKNSWCHSYCPRANMFDHFINKAKVAGLTSPKWLLDGRGKQMMLGYFTANVFVLTMSTLMVFLDRREPLEKIRFLIAFQIPLDIPQLLNIAGVPDWAVHLGFRFYSMMLTTTIIGLLLGLLYKPKTWCAVCPMATMTNAALGKKQFSALQRELS